MNPLASGVLVAYLKRRTKEISKINIKLKSFSSRINGNHLETMRAVWQISRI